MGRRRGLSSLLVGIGLCFSAVVAPGQSQGNGGLSISGYVRDDANHQPIKAVALELVHSTGSTAAPAGMSGVTGEFLFGGLGSGDYRILAHQKGYDPAVVEVRVGGTSLVDVTVSMHRIETPDVTGQGDAISAHQLSVPENARADFEKGMKFFIGVKPDYRKALASFERAVKEFPDYYEAYAEIGVVHQRLGESAEAEKALRKSVEMSASRYPDALFLLAEMLNDEGHFADAEGFARQCVQQDESLWTCDLELARGLAGLKRPAEAEAAAAKASELNPSNAKTYLVLGNIHIQEHKYEAVVADFDAYLKLDPAGPASEAVRASQAQARKVLGKR